MIILIFFTLSLLAFCVIINRGHYTAPSVLFTFGFLVCFYVAFLYQQKWSFVLHDITLIVVCVGLSSFVLASLAFKPVVINRYSIRDCNPRNSQLLPVYKLSIFFFLALGLFAIVLTFVALVQLYPDKGLLDAISAYNDAVKFGNDNVSMPRYVLVLRNISLYFGYIACYLLAQQIIKKDKSNLKILMVLMFETLVLSVQSGARSGAIGYVVFFFVCYEILQWRAFGFRPLSLKTLIFVIAFVALLALGFQSSLVLLGRSGGDLSFLDYLSIYCGAQLPNLDIFLTENWANNNYPWGAMTFITSYHDLGNWLNISIYDYSIDLPFQSRAGQSMGNVYTMFYALYYDFGLLGVVVLAALAGVVSKFIFFQACYGGNNFKTLFFILLYGMLAYNILLSFFTNRLYESFICLGLIRVIIYILISLILYHVIGQKNAFKQIED